MAALINTDSVTIVSTSGLLETVIDIKCERSLKSFTELILEFKISKSLCKQARNLGIAEPKLIQDANNLLESLMEKNWRLRPMLCDVPSNPQIFGQLVFLAGIEGILYSSVITNSDCLAIFSRNFVNTNSYVEIDDIAPSSQTPIRLHSSNWELSERDWNWITEYADKK